MSKLHLSWGMPKPDPYLLYGQVEGQTYTREQRTDAYVSIPPAAIITDESGGTWVFGQDYIEERGRYWFAVMRNDVNTGELAERIEYRKGHVAIYTRLGRKIWNGQSFI